MEATLSAKARVKIAQLAFQASQVGFETIFYSNTAKNWWNNMISILAPSVNTRASECSNRILCFYINETSRIQILRLVNSTDKKFERVIFPGQRLLFEAVPDAKIELMKNDVTGNIIWNMISCNSLRVMEGEMGNG